ncbi:MAG: hypothetical protein ACOYNS_04530 [Bacteroidota bacterium]
MEKPIAKFFLFLFVLSALVWMYASSMKNYQAGMLFEFGTANFKQEINADVERTIYRTISENALIAFVSYPLTILAAAGFAATTRWKFRIDGWLMMSAILLFGFVPVELYCAWLDWKIVGLNYWGDWPLEEFRKAILMRMTALAGLPFIAQLCYFTIPFFIIFKPLQKQEA